MIRGWMPYHAPRTDATDGFKHRQSEEPRHHPDSYPGQSVTLSDSEPFRILDAVRGGLLPLSIAPHLTGCSFEANTVNVLETGLLWRRLPPS